MVGLWEGVPASPCSGASDEAPAHNVPTRYSTRNRAKRTRATARVEASSVGFVDAKSSRNNGKDATLVDKLNSTASDERRKILLAKLRLIDQRKAALKGANNGLSSAAISRDSISNVFEATTPEPDDTDPGLSADANKLSNSMNKPSHLTLDVTAVRSCRRGPANTNNLYSSPKDSASSIFGSPIASPTLRRKGSASLSYADLPTRRSSRRTTRPRTPNVLLNGMPGETVLQKLPVGVLKCKRYSFCKKVVSILIKNPSATPFSAPVKDMWRPEAIPRYFDVISRPMDLGTIKKNLESVHYLNMEQADPLLMFQPETFADDVRQVFRNAKIYNRTGDSLYNCASDLLNDFEQMWKALPEIPSKDGSRKRQGTSTRPGTFKRGRLGDLAVGARTRPNNNGPKSPMKANSSNPSEKSGKATFTLDETMNARQLRRRLDYLKKCRIAIRSRTMLPKGATFYDRAALLHDVPLLDSQKNAILKGISQLPAAKQATLLEIIGKSEDDDEVEIDIASYDTKILRNIESFLESSLANFKTIRNSSVGTEFDSADDFEEEFRLIQAKLTTAKQPKVVRKVEPPVEPVVCVPAPVEPTNQLYASSDEEDSASDSDSDSSDSETE